MGIADFENGVAAVEFLSERADGLAGGHNFHFLKLAREVAGKTAARALEGSHESDHLLSHIVRHRHLERAQRAAALPRAAVVFLGGEKNLLTHTVQDLNYEIKFFENL